MFLDEKVLIPVTLYGLPMLKVTTPDLQTVQSHTENAVDQLSVRYQADDYTIVTFEMDPISKTV